MGSRLLKFYQEALRKRPYLVQAVQAGTLMGAGDLISQTFIEKRSPDLKRTLKFSSIGFFIGGPVLRLWYGILNKHIGSKGKYVAIKKVFIDQAVFAPTFLGMILVTQGALQGKKWPVIKMELSSNYFDVLSANYYIWPWVQIVNFYYIPLQYQVLVVQTVALFWNTYLAWKTNKKLLLDIEDISV